MTLIEVLPQYEAKRFDRPPLFSQEERKFYLKPDNQIQTLLNQAKQPETQVGMMLQYGYFKATGKFFHSRDFKPKDIRYVMRALNLSLGKNWLSNYFDRTRQKQRQQITVLCGYTPLSEHNDFFVDAIGDLVAKQVHPHKLFYILITRLRERRIVLPSYDKIVRTITDELNRFEKQALDIIKYNINQEQEGVLQDLLATDGEYYRRPLLTKLKQMSQSVRPGKIKLAVHSFLIVKKLFKEVEPLIDKLSLSSEATVYYAKWVIKAKITQLTDIKDKRLRCLYLLAFIDYCYCNWQDTLVDILQKSTQHHINLTEKTLDQVTKERLPQKNKLASSVLSGFHATNSVIDTAKGVLYDQALSNDERIDRLKTILPEVDSSPDTVKTRQDADELASELKKDNAQNDYYVIRSNLARKLKNRIGEIVKALEIECNRDPYAQDLYEAVVHYQQKKTISHTAPDSIFDDNEYKAVFQSDRFNGALYQALLFCKLSDAIKCGMISLKHSYRYLSIDAYLINKPYWQQNKTKLLNTLGLSAFSDVRSVLGDLRNKIDKQFFAANRRILNGKNRFVKYKENGGFTVHTPAVEKPDYDSVAEIIGHDRYVPILQMMEEVNFMTEFSDCFVHHKTKDTKLKPKKSIIYAGLFGIGSNIDLHKLANTSIGLNYNTLSHTVNWYFSLDNLYAVNEAVVEAINKMWLPKKFKREKNLLHTSSDAKKRSVTVESLNANESFKYFGSGKGTNIYRFIDERGILFYTTVFSSSERDALYVIDGLLHNDTIKSDRHSTDTHGYTEMVFSMGHFIGNAYAPRIKDLDGIELLSFEKIKSQLDKKGYQIQPGRYVKEQLIIDNWDDILRLMATILLRKHRASTILKRLGAYSKQHPLQAALKEFGRVIKTNFILQYIDDVSLRQSIEKQLNKSELANRFADAVSFADQNILDSQKEDQEITAMCRTILQNIIILWNYVELTKIIMRSDQIDRKSLLENITQSSILTWQHVSLYGTYDFSNLTGINDSEFSFEEVLNFKVA